MKEVRNQKHPPPKKWNVLHINALLDKCSSQDSYIYRGISPEFIKVKVLINIVLT